MGKTYERIDGRLRSIIERQPVFFVATAPLAGGGHVNLSPKGRPPGRPPSCGCMATASRSSATTRAGPG